MQTENTVLMRVARESLNGKWGLAIGTFLLYYVLPILFYGVPVIGWIASIILQMAFVTGITIFSLSISRNQDARLEQLFSGFKKTALVFTAALLMFVFVLLWSLLLVIPGIIAALSYSMTYYIIAEDNSVGAMEAIDRSKKMMDGYKWKYFRLLLRFFGLSLLCILTLGIGFLWLIPYFHVTNAKFYDDIKSNADLS
ncbi:MAG: hypothetical protein RL213_1400 [Bacteroidota bacterium]